MILHFAVVTVVVALGEKQVVDRVPLYVVVIHVCDCVFEFTALVVVVLTLAPLIVVVDAFVTVVDVALVVVMVVTLGAKQVVTSVPLDVVIVHVCVCVRGKIIVDGLVMVDMFVTVDEFAELLLRDCWYTITVLAAITARIRITTATSILEYARLPVFDSSRISFTNYTTYGRFIALCF